MLARLVQQGDQYIRNTEVVYTALENARSNGPGSTILRVQYAGDLGIEEREFNANDDIPLTTPEPAQG